jgi:hypothetical protein
LSGPYPSMDMVCFFYYGYRVKWKLESFPIRWVRFKKWGHGLAESMW